MSRFEALCDVDEVLKASVSFMQADRHALLRTFHLYSTVALQVLYVNQVSRGCPAHILDRNNHGAQTQTT